MLCVMKGGMVELPFRTSRLNLNFEDLLASALVSPNGARRPAAELVNISVT